VEVADPFTGETAFRLWLGDGAVATSGIDARLWRRPDATYGHHHIDPARGEPAWTGLVSATALAPTALEAETLAKAALLSGAAAGRRLLARDGGLLVHDDGAIELAGPLARLRRAA
jgi:thiamine biosynthesis lipoprotein